MRIRHLFFCAALTAVVTGLSSCAQTDLSRIEGEWRLFYTNHLNDPNIYIYEFTADDELIVTRFPFPTDANPNPAPQVIGRGKYEKKAEFLDAVITIYEVITQNSALHTQLSSCCMGEERADWEILKINNEVLQIGTPDAGGYVMREFTREN
jgi:hypothetical protein